MPTAELSPSNSKYMDGVRKPPLQSSLDTKYLPGLKDIDNRARLVFVTQKAGSKRHVGPRAPANWASMH